MQRCDNHDAGPSALRDPPSDSDRDTSPGTFPPSAKLRDKLNKLENWRIDLSSIEFVNGASGYHGGYATVSRAFLASPSSCQHRTSQSDPTTKDGLDSPGPAGEASPQRKDVAVKKMHISDDPARILGLALREAEFLVGLSHENVIKLEGFVEDLSNDVVWLVFPWAENGNLKSFIASAEWEIPERIWLIYDVAAGVEYLHSQQPPIRHGDLKSINILVNSEYRAFITDFGSARRQTVEDHDEETSQAENKPPPALWLEPTISGTTNTMTLTLKGDHFTLRWAAPELLYNAKATLATDIWAFGFVVYEVMTNSIPFQDVEVDNAVIIRVITGNLPSITGNARMALIQALCSLALACWNQDPRKRPTAEDCRKSIQWMPMIRPDPIRSPDAAAPHSPELLVQLGDMYRGQGDHMNALEFFTKALDIYREAGNKKGTATALVALAQVHRLLNEYSQAAKFYTEALQIRTEIGDNPGRAYVLWGLGEVHRFLAEYTQATTLFSEALKMRTELGDNAGRSRALYGLAEVARLQEKYSQAVTIYTESLHICTDIGDRHGVAYALWGVAEVHRNKKEFSQAIEVFSDTLQIQIDIGDRHGRAWTLMCLADIYREQEQYEDATRLYEEAARFFGEIGNTQNEDNVLSRAAEARQRLESTRTE